SSVATSRNAEPFGTPSCSAISWRLTSGRAGVKHRSTCSPLARALTVYSSLGFAAGVERDPGALTVATSACSDLRNTTYALRGELKHGGDALAARRAQGCQAVGGPPLGHLVQQGHADSGARVADGVAEG